MKILEVRLSGFGKFADLILEFPENLKIVVGPNEAGKSTVVDAILGVLFGFRKGQKALRERYQPWRGQGYSASLVIGGDHGERYLVGRDFHHDRLEVFRGQGVRIEPQPETELECFLLDSLGINNPQLFESILLIRQPEVALIGRDRGSANRLAEALGRKISGSDDNATPVQALDALRRKLAEIGAAQGPGSLAAFAAEAAEKERELAEIDRGCAHYASLVEERDRLRSTLAVLEPELKEIASRVDGSRVAVVRAEARAHLAAELAEVLQQLAEMAPPEGGPPGVAEDRTAPAGGTIDPSLLARAEELGGRLAGAEVDRRYTFKKKGTTWVGLTPAAVVISINHDKEQAGIEARAYFDPVATILNPSPENFKLNHTYRIIAKSGVEKHTLPGGEPIIDVTAQDLPAALKAMNYTPADVLQVKVFKSSGKLGTDGGVSAGWSKCTESMEQEDETAKLYKERDLESAEAPPMSEEEFAAKANGRPWPGKAPAAPAPAPAKVSEKEIAEAKKAAGTRAEMLDLVDICFESGYQRQMKAGYANLDNERRYIDNPEECFETCTHGFHFAFDTKHPEEKELHICSDPKCLSKKKGAFTRKQNAAGQARKNAEKTAIKQALSKVASVAGLESQDQVVAVMKPVLYLFIYNQLHGANVEDNYYRDDVKKPEKWLWDKLSAGTKSEARKEPALWKLIKKLPDVDLAMLVTEYCFYYLQDHGNVGRYEIKTEQPLSFFDIAISVPVGDTVDKSEAGGEQEEEDEDGDE